MSFYDSHKQLFKLFAGYLNQGWMHIYVWEDQEPTYQPIVRKYKTEDSKEGIEETVAQLKDILTIGKNFEYDEWVDVLTYDLGLAFRPKGFGLTHQEWLEDVLRILEEPVEETRKHFIPERI